MSGPPDSPVFFTDRDLGTRFPEILSAAGVDVQRHRDLFAHDCSDELWLEAVGRNGWIAISHDARIRYKPNERAAVIEHKARLLVVVGKAPFPELASNFARTLPRIVEFVGRHPAPWIAKIYRPQPAEIARNLEAPGSVLLWYSPRAR